MDEITNKQLNDKLFDNFNKVFQETFSIRQKNDWLIEHIEYIHSNTLHTFQVVNELELEIKKLKMQLTTLQHAVSNLQK